MVIKTSGANKQQTLPTNRTTQPGSISQFLCLRLSFLSLEGLIQALGSPRFSHTTRLAWPAAWEQTGIERHCGGGEEPRESPQPAKFGQAHAVCARAAVCCPALAPARHPGAL